MLTWPQNAGHPISKDLNFKNFPDWAAHGTLDRGTTLTGLYCEPCSLKSCISTPVYFRNRVYIHASEMGH